MKARRLPTDREAIHDLWEVLEPGDYMGPIAFTEDNIPSVFYRLPNSSFGHVTSPPHTFRECDDGSLEIRASIGHHYHLDDGTLAYWHGYLDEGNVWRELQG